MLDLGREGIIRENEEINAASPRVGNRVGINILRIVLVCFIAVIVMGLCMGIGAYQGIIEDSPEITDTTIMPMGYASFIYDQNGNQMQKLNSVEGNRVSISIGEIPQDMQHAIVAIEDSRFYEHNGVDPHGMIRAVLVAVQSGLSRTEGASTITQQLLKNNVFTQWLYESRMQSLKRKIQEQYLAVELEKSLKQAGQDPKSVILENYLNTVNFGHGAYGVETAAQTYFGKDARDLTLSESAVLAAIPQNPSQYDPIIFPEDNAGRMHTVLDYMLEQGYITEESYSAALADNVYDRIEENSQRITEGEVYSFFVDELISQIKRDLMTQKGYTEQQANNAIYSSGMRIYSTEDPRIQDILEEEFSNPQNFPGTEEVGLDWAITVDKADGTRQNYSREMLQAYFMERTDPDFDLIFASAGDAQYYVDEYKKTIVGGNDEIVAERTSFIPQPQACMTVIDQSTGQIKGIIGARGEKTGSLTLNRATDSYRQPGLTFQIPTAYGPALELGRITLATQETDRDPVEEGEEPDYSYYEETQGEMTVREAIVSENNVIAVKVLQQITPKVGFEYLTRLGFTNIDKDEDVNQYLALGGLINGVNNVELTAAYAAIAGGGVYMSPCLYTKVTDRQGNIILESTPIQTRIFRDTTSWLLTDAMKDSVARGTATDYQLSNKLLPVAGVNGTTGAWRDIVFAGFTPYYTAAIWGGYDMNIELPESDRQFVSRLWTNVMNRIHEGVEVSSFNTPSGVQQLTVCSESGLLAGRGCTAVTDYFDVSTAPTVVCTEHVPTPAPTPIPVNTQPPTRVSDGNIDGQNNGLDPNLNMDPNAGYVDPNLYTDPNAGYVDPNLYTDPNSGYVDPNLYTDPNAGYIDPNLYYDPNTF